MTTRYRSHRIRNACCIAVPRKQRTLSVFRTSFDPTAYNSAHSSSFNSFLIIPATLDEAHENLRIGHLLLILRIGNTFRTANLRNKPARNHGLSAFGIFRCSGFFLSDGRCSNRPYPCSLQIFRSPPQQFPVWIILPPKNLFPVWDGIPWRKPPGSAFSDLDFLSVRKYARMLRLSVKSTLSVTGLFLWNEACFCIQIILQAHRCNSSSINMLCSLHDMIRHATGISYLWRRCEMHLMAAFFASCIPYEPD